MLEEQTPVPQPLRRTDDHDRTGQEVPRPDTGPPICGPSPEATGVSQQRVSAIENGSVAELATLADYIRPLAGELKVIADFGDSWQRVA
jgi:hypothetical protein